MIFALIGFMRAAAGVSDPAALGAAHWWPARTANLTGDPDITQWDDEVATEDITPDVAGKEPTRNTSPLRVTFTASDNLGASALSTLATDIGDWAYSITCRILSNDTDSSSSWNNNTIMGDEDNDFWGLHVKGTASPFTIRAYNWDGAEKTADESLASNTWAVITWGVTGGNLFVKLNKQTRVTTVSGDTTDASGGVDMGSFATSAEMDVLDAVFWDGGPGDSVIADYVDWVNDEYGLSL